ncbi:unnamed protein product [Caenorhabditis sp. 36 PRJEB53466]|nr:unnamed protein product [Caenorhabditis sp. 36 PRJEB53466]
MDARMLEFVAEKAKRNGERIPTEQLWNEFKQATGALESAEMLNHRFQTELAPRLHLLEHIDESTRTAMLRVAGSPSAEHETHNPRKSRPFPTDHESEAKKARFEGGHEKDVEEVMMVCEEQEKPKKVHFATEPLEKKEAEPKDEDVPIRYPILRADIEMFETHPMYSTGYTGNWWF